MTRLPIGLQRRLVCAASVCCALLAACAEDDHAPPQPPSAEWRMFGGSLERQSFNGGEATVTAQTVARLIPRWRFLTGAIVTAAPVVADVDLPGEGRVKAVFEPSWDGYFYALRARDGTLIWSYRFKPQPGAEFVQGAAAAVDDIDGRRLVYVAAGETMYGFDAATGALIWQFDAGTGCTDCDRFNERNEILSPPAVYRGTIYFGMDVNQLASAKGGFYALDARTGLLRWYFDLDTAATCRPDAGDQIRRFDGFHSAQSLGLPDDFFATRAGCGLDRQGNGCGSVYGGAAIDAKRGLLYAASSNCDAPSGTPPSNPPYTEAIFALTLEGVPVWVWRPRDVDPLDLDFGATPNLFTATIAGIAREVVGVGGKDGTYYLLDRDGMNALTGRTEPYWVRNVVPGGAQGGIIASAAVAMDTVVFSTAFGTDENGPGNYQKPAAWGLNVADGTVRWSNPTAPPSYSPASAIPGVAFFGSFSGTVYAYDSATGQRLARLSSGGLGLYSQAVVVDGRLYVGSGIGAHEGPPEDTAFAASLIRSSISAFCVSGTQGCPDSGSCIDGNPCTVDVLQPNGECSNALAADGTACSVGTLTGTCKVGNCDLPDLDCDDHNQCTIDMRTAHGCAYQSAPEGTPCTVGDRQDTCHAGACGTEPS